MWAGQADAKLPRRVDSTAARGRPSSRWAPDRSGREVGRAIPSTGSRLGEAARTPSPVVGPARAPARSVARWRRARRCGPAAVPLSRLRGWPPRRSQAAVAVAVTAERGAAVVPGRRRRHAADPRGPAHAPAAPRPEAGAALKCAAAGAGAGALAATATVKIGAAYDPARQPPGPPQAGPSHPENPD